MTYHYREGIMKIKIEKDFDKHIAGTIKEIEDINGLPIERYWRNRLKDAEIDGCVTLVKSKKRGK